MTHYSTRRDFLCKAGLSAMGVNLALGLPSLSRAVESHESSRKQRLIFVFSPNGVIPKHFWPDTLGEEFEMKRILGSVLICFGFVAIVLFKYFVVKPA